MYGLVYRITHRESGRVYVGQTTQGLAVRWKSHQRQPFCVRLHRAIQKHGAAAFDVETIAQADNRLQLDCFERFWIGVHQATDRAHGFNLREGGSFGKHSEESRAKMSRRVREALTDPSYRKKLSESQRGRVVTEETRERIAKSNTGKQHTSETKTALSELRKQLWQDPAYREAVRAAQSAGKLRPEVRAANAERARAQWADPECRKRMLDAVAAGKARAKQARKQ